MNKDIKELIKTYKRVFESSDGEEILEDLKKRCNFYSTSFSNDSHETAFREGQRSVVLMIDQMKNKNLGGKNE